MILGLLFLFSSIGFADEIEIIEKDTDKETLNVGKPAGVVQLSDEFYPGFSILSSINLSGNFRTEAVEASVEETFKMSDGGVNAFISIPFVLNEYRPGNNSVRNTPRIGGGPLPVLKFGFEVYRDQDAFGELGARIFLPYDSSNRMRFGVMIMVWYKHRHIIGRFVIDASFSAGTSFSKEVSNSGSGSVFSVGNSQTTEQEPVFNSSLEFFPSYLLSDSLGIIFGGVWNYRSPARGTQNGVVVFSQSASNDLGFGAGVRIQMSKSSILTPLFYRMVTPPEVENRNNMGMILSWLVYF